MERKNDNEDKLTMSTDSTNAAVVKLATNDGANLEAPVDVLRLSRAINSMLQDLGIENESNDQSLRP
ncbi:hypothetical protein KIN20_034779 [Parelaphostrongylus tenuis]|uniref:SKP1 component POZ domain-containing protein n=1 Tax=Parelaphostrongylus tenuis TaxID=148309 RepID=A0AAD5RAY1_PARTN|nr:hypothetical protein KIN20_034779 [Parelaphostrongylus tenuis]